MAQRPTLDDVIFRHPQPQPVFAPPADFMAQPNQRGQDDHTLEEFIKRQGTATANEAAEGMPSVAHGMLGTGLKFEELSYVVTKRVKEQGKSVAKQVSLLKGISGQALKGEVTAVLGPSGAGKSTLLDALAGRIAKGSLGGRVTVDGRQISASRMNKISAYVMQEDQLFPMLTVYETLMFAAEVRLEPAMSKREKEARVDDLLERLGLQTVAHSYIGDEGKRGVSGGERRRVSIGVDIIHCPPLLFLDEPTSGLDSTSAYSVVEKLCQIAKGGSTVLLTVHQPSSRIQNLFNTMIILGRGNLVYSGTHIGLSVFLEAFGRQHPDGDNPVEYFLDVVKEYDESTHGLAPLVRFQRDGTKPSEAMKTPQPKTPARSGTPQATAQTPSALDLATVADQDEMDFDYSLVRQTPTPLSTFGNPQLASQFYKDFPIWLYNEVVDTIKGAPPPARDPTTPAYALTPGKTPARTPGRTPGRTPARSAAPQLNGHTHFNHFQDSVKAISSPHPPLPEDDAEADVEGNDPLSFIISDIDKEEGDHDLGPKFANPWSRELRLLMKRNFLNIIRSPELFLTRELVYIVLCFMLWTLFKSLNTQNNISIAYDLLNFFIFTMCLLFFSSNDAVPTFIQERYIFIRETTHNAYRASSYVASSFLVNLPFFAVQAITFTLITFYGMQLKGSIAILWLVTYTSLIATNSFVMFVSSMVSDYITGYALVINITALFLLTCGFFVKRTQIPHYWIWLHYASLIKYPFEGLLINQFNSDPSFCYSNSTDATPGPMGALKPNPQYDRNRSGCAIGGPDILYSIDITQESVLFDILVILGWGAFYRLLFYVILRLYSKNMRK